LSPPSLLGWGVFGVVLCFVSCFGGVLRLLLGGFGYCFATVQLLVCLSGSGFPVLFDWWWCACGCLNGLVYGAF